MVFEKLRVCFHMPFHHALLSLLSFGLSEKLFFLIRTSLLLLLLLPPKEPKVLKAQP